MAVFSPASFNTTSFSRTSFNFGTVEEVVIETLKGGLSKLGIEITEEEIFAAVIAALTVMN